MVKFLLYTTTLISFVSSSFVWVAGSNTSCTAPCADVYEHPDPKEISPIFTITVAPFLKYSDTELLYLGSRGDVWVFNTVTHLWKWMFGCRATVGSDQIFFITPNVPNTTVCFPRMTFTHWFYDKVRNSTYVFNGGTSSPYVSTVSSSIWETSIMFNVSLTTGERTLLRVHTEYPGTPVSHQRSYAPFGAGVEHPSNIPAARTSAVLFYDPTLGSCFVYGGYIWASDDVFGDMWRYNVVSNMWEWLHGTFNLTSPGNINSGASGSELFPSGRSSAGYAYDQVERKLYMFGGSNRLYKVTSDLWSYDVNENTFALLGGVQEPVAQEVYGVPGEFGSTFIPRSRYGMAFALNSTSKTLYMFHGATFGNLYMSDVWAFSLALGQFAWIDGLFVTNQRGYSGEKGVWSPANIPPSTQYWQAIEGHDGIYITNGQSRGIGVLSSVWKFVDDGKIYGPLLANYTQKITTTATTTGANEAFLPSSSNASQFNWQIVATVAAASIVLVLGIVLVTIFEVRRRRSTKNYATSSNATSTNPQAAPTSTVTGTVTGTTAYQTVPSTLYGDVTTTQGNTTQFGQV